MLSDYFFFRSYFRVETLIKSGRFEITLDVIIKHESWSVLVVVSHCFKKTKNNLGVSMKNIFS